MLAERLKAWAEERGYRAAWGPWRAVREAADDLAERLHRAEIDVEFDKQYLSRAAAAAPGPDQARSWVLMVAVPKPAHTVKLTAGGRVRTLAIPPTYVRFRHTREEVLEDLKTSVFEGRPAPVPLLWPLKGVACRLGLAAYGRNNVLYADGIGSYFQLVGLLTNDNLSEGASAPRAPVQLAACERCTICMEACPTGAIPEERFLLRAERCLVYFNERPDEFPSWIPPSAHRCLVGCLACQTACPENARRLKVEDSGVVLTEEETQSILEDPTPRSSAHLQSACDKLSALELTEDPAALWRNVRTLFAARGWSLGARGS